MFNFFIKFIFSVLSPFFVDVKNKSIFVMKLSLLIDQKIYLLNFGNYIYIYIYSLNLVQIFDFILKNQLYNISKFIVCHIFSLSHVIYRFEISFNRVS